MAEGTKSSIMAKIAPKGFGASYITQVACFGRFQVMRNLMAVIVRLYCRDIPRLNSRFRTVGSIYVLGATVDNLFTYLFVKLWGVYTEANPIIMLYWMNKPLWMWVIKDLTGLLIALLASIFYRKLADLLISISRPNAVLIFMRRAWLWPLYLVTAIRCLPAIHNALLVFFSIETPLAELICKILTF